MAIETNGVTHQDDQKGGFNQKVFPVTGSLHGHDAAMAAAMQGIPKERTANSLSTASR